MSTTVWFRENEKDEWKPASPLHQSIDENRAHRFADRFNKKYGHGMWWVKPSKPSEDCVVPKWWKKKV